MIFLSSLNNLPLSKNKSIIADLHWTFQCPWKWDQIHPPNSLPQGRSSAALCRKIKSVYSIFELENYRKNSGSTIFLDGIFSILPSGPIISLYSAWQIVDCKQSYIRYYFGKVFGTTTVILSFNLQCRRISQTSPAFPLCSFQILSSPTTMFPPRHEGKVWEIWGWSSDLCRSTPLKYVIWLSIHCHQHHGKANKSTNERNLSS